MIRVELREDDIRFDDSCALCDGRFREENPQPVAYGDDGQRLGSVCPECFKALQAGGTAVLVARLNTMADCWNARTAELAECEIPIEGTDGLPDDPRRNWLKSAGGWIETTGRK